MGPRLVLFVLLSLCNWVEPVVELGVGQIALTQPRDPHRTHYTGLVVYRQYCRMKACQATRITHLEQSMRNEARFSRETERSR